MMSEEEIPFGRFKIFDFRQLVEEKLLILMLLIFFRVPMGSYGYGEGLGKLLTAYSSLLMQL